MNLQKRYAQLFEGKLRSNDKALLAEGDMTRQYDGFIVSSVDNKLKYKFRYMKGIRNNKVEDVAIADVMKKTGKPRSYFWVTGGIKKGQWDQTKAEILETRIKEANEIPLPEDIIKDGMDEVNRVIDELRDLEQTVMSSIEMYQEETGDLRFEQILNQGARYIQSAERNLEYLHKMLKRNL
jgi:hypothetical protein